MLEALEALEDIPHAGALRDVAERRRRGRGSAGALRLFSHYARVDDALETAAVSRFANSTW